MVAEVTVLPVPGGPWISDKGAVSTAATAASCGVFSSGSPGAESSAGSAALTACGATVCPNNLRPSTPAQLRQPMNRTAFATCVRQKPSHRPLTACAHAQGQPTG